jgi:hypothetical protein
VFSTFGVTNRMTPALWLFRRRQCTLVIRRTYPWSREPVSFYHPKLTLQLAYRRVSLADYRGNVVLDTLVRPTYVMEMWLYSFGLIEMLAASHEVTNYRTAETGLVSAHLTNGNFMCISRQDSGLLETYRKLSATVS